jgi:hypothetical protein
MRQVRVIGTGLAVLLGGLGWAGLAGAQLPMTAPYVANPAPQMAPTPAAPAATQTQASQPPSTPGSVTVRLNGRITAGFGAVSDSGRSR